MFQALLNWIRSLFFAKSLECCIVGLQNSGYGICTTLTVISFCSLNSGLIDICGYLPLTARHR